MLVGGGRRRGFLRQLCLLSAFLMTAVPGAGAGATLPMSGVVFPAPGDSLGRFEAAAVGSLEIPRTIQVIEPRPGHGSDRRLEPMSWFVMTGVGQHLRGEPSGLPVLEALELWAETGALEVLRPERAGGSLVRSRYSLKRILLPLLAGYAVLRRDLDPPPARRQIIEGWLGRLVELARPADGPTTGQNNHRYMRDAILVAWGALAGDLPAFTEGVAGVRAAVGAMRPDGAWPLEIARGQRALFYQRHAIASLVAAAEIALVQGIDLYRSDDEGRSLHRAIAYLLEGIARADQSQDLTFLRLRGNGRHYLAWSEAYVARFPAHPNAIRLRALTAGAARPMIDDYSGGDVSALVGGSRPGQASG